MPSIFSHLLALGLHYAPLVVVWIAGGIALKLYHQLTPNQRILAWLVWFDLLLETIVLVYLYLDLNNLFFIPIISLGEAGLLLLLYRQVLESKAISISATWIFGGLVVYALVNVWFIADSLYYWPSLQLICSLLELGLAGLYFRKLMNELRVEHLEYDPLFIVSVGLLLYTLGDLFITLFSNYTLANFSTGFNKIFWRIHLFLNVMLYLCYSIALWIRPPKPSS